MKLMTIVFASIFAVLACAGSAQAAVSRVIIVETADSAAYLKNLDKVRAMNTRLGNKSVIRTWRARFAGHETGALVVVIEYADMNNFAAEDTKLRGDAEFQALQKDMEKMRKIVSDSLYDELKCSHRGPERRASASPAPSNTQRLRGLTPLTQPHTSPNTRAKFAPSTLSIRDALCPRCASACAMPSKRSTRLRSGRKL
jgi:hypothetical protein